MGKPIKEKLLSASRLKTLETCSWAYWCNYHLKLPQKQNEGASRGTVCHLVFEMLIKKKHKKHFDKISKHDSIDGSPAVVRLIMKHLRKMEANSDLPMTNDENVNLIRDMIMVGLVAPSSVKVLMLLTSLSPAKYHALCPLNRGSITT